MIVCWRTVRIPRAERERFGAWVQANRTVRQQHGILFELVLDRSARQNPAKAPQPPPPPDHHGNDTDGVLEAVVVTAWASHDAFDAWINTPDRDRLTASPVHQSVTRARPKTDRSACPWLMRRFIDPQAEILYVPADQVLTTAKQEDARSFDAPDAEFTHQGNRCTFEVLID